MRAKVDPDTCVGTGSCVSICPEVFEMGDEGVAVVKADPVPADAEATCKEAADACPTGAIEVSD